MIYLMQLDSKVPSGIFGDRLRNSGYPHRLLRLFLGDPFPVLDQAAALMVLGGTMSVQDTDRHPFLIPLKAFMRQAVDREVPLLGICLGAQLLAEVLGARVTRNHRGEKGILPLTLTPDGRRDPLFSAVPQTFHSFLWHNDSFEIPSGALHLATSIRCPGQAFRFGRAYGLQFHPEVDEAVVDAWSRAFGDGPEVLEDFRRGKNPHLDTSAKILSNFLDIV